MKPRRRRWWLWPVAGVAAVLGLAIFWPVRSEFAFLNSFHPKQRLEKAYYTYPPHPAGYVRAFDFTQPLPEIVERVSTHWPYASPSDANAFRDGRRSMRFKNPTGEVTELWLPAKSDETGITCSLIVWDDNPSWMEERVEMLRNWLHLD